MLIAGDFVGYRYIAFELCDMSLEEVLLGRHELAPLPPRHVAEIAYQLLQAIGCMFSCDVVLLRLISSRFAFFVYHTWRYQA